MFIRNSDKAFGRKIHVTFNRYFLKAKIIWISRSITTGAAAPTKANKDKKNFIFEPYFPQKLKNKYYKNFLKNVF